MQRVWSTYLDPGSNSSHGHNGQDTAGRSTNDYPRHRRTSSSMSHANSIASSQRHILADHDYTMPLEPPNAPFTGLPHQAPSSPSSSLRTMTGPGPAANNNSDNASTTNNSLSVNFFPSKFSYPFLSPGGTYKRKGKGGKGGAVVIPKQGGGREAFKSGEARMPGEKDEDYDGVDMTRGTWKSKLRWNRFKWILFCTNLLVSIYSLVSLIFCLLTWFNVWTHADVIRVGNRNVLILSTIASTFGILSSLIGWAGILLNNRSFLATYNLLLWITFAFICAPGYVAYKTRTFNLEGKVNAQWSRDLGMEGRLRIQNQLGCCGYYSPFVEATSSQLCYARSVLPGCKNPYLKFERTALERWYSIAFGLVPFHLAAILAGLMCSNHVTYRFGKGMMPKRYRLSVGSMAVIMDNYANQLVEQFGGDVASELIARSRSNLNLVGSVPSLHYGFGMGSGLGSGSGTNTPSLVDAKKL